MTYSAPATSACCLHVARVDRGDGQSLLAETRKTVSLSEDPGPAILAPVLTVITAILSPVAAVITAIVAPVVAVLDDRGSAHDRCCSLDRSAEHALSIRSSSA